MTERTIFNFNGKVALIEWFDVHRRLLPWRDHSNPYAIWLSEVILQQTRVEQGLPYWERFMSKYPSVEKLADAPFDEIMALWAGLGYYSRARNLHAAAKAVVALGGFPSTRDGLLDLPGVGPYTAAAISSMAFQEVVPALDGNALRVYTRYFAVAERIDQKRTLRHIEELCTPLLDSSRPGDSNQAIMDLGSRICTPTRPQCGECPLQHGCEAHRRGTMESFPVKPAKKPPRRKPGPSMSLSLSGNLAWFVAPKKEFGPACGASQAPCLMNMSVFPAFARNICFPTECLHWNFTKSWKISPARKMHGLGLPSKR